MRRLTLNKFPQYSEGITLFQTKSFEPAQEFYIPKSEQPSYRIQGGTAALIQALEGTIPKELIYLNKKVTTINLSAPSQVSAEMSVGSIFSAKRTFICFPPTIATNIQFTPNLPESLAALLPQVQTWMAGSVKFTVEYDNCFWRKKGMSGMLYSHAGPITEMYDHCNFAHDKFAFTGFLNSGVQNFTPKVREKLVLNQLVPLLGSEAARPLHYRDKIWNEDTVFSGQGFFPSPHFNNGHPALSLGYFDNRLFFSGSETSTDYPGYMEGAISAAYRAAEHL